jgi:hypothetical protein
LALPKKEVAKKSRREQFCCSRRSLSHAAWQSKWRFEITMSPRKFLLATHPIWFSKGTKAYFPSFLYRFDQKHSHQRHALEEPAFSHPSLPFFARTIDAVEN